MNWILVESEDFECGDFECPGHEKMYVAEVATGCFVRLVSEEVTVHLQYAPGTCLEDFGILLEDEVENEN